MTTPVEAAQNLVRRLQAPAQAHSVWVNRQLIDGEFRDRICISIHPKCTKPLNIPDNIDGYEVAKLPWPTDMV